MSPRQC